jgi:hypothetical protein
VIGGPCVMFIGVTLSRRHFLEDTLLAPHGIADTAAPELAVRCGEPWIGASPVTLGTQGRFAIGAQKRFARLTSRSRRAPIRNCRIQRPTPPSSELGIGSNPGVYALPGGQVAVPSARGPLIPPNSARSIHWPPRPSPTYPAFGDGAQPGGRGS